MKNRDGVRMGQKQTIENHIHRLYYKSRETHSPGSHIIGFDLIIENMPSSLLKDAFVKTIKKHKILNSKFFIDADGLKSERIELQRIAWIELECVSTTTEDLRNRILSEAPLYIIPEKGQNIAGRLYRLSDSKYILSVTASHLVTDAKSMEILLKDFLNELKTQCIDGNRSEETLTFLLPGPLNRQQSYEVVKTLDLSTLQNLKTLCHQEDVSLFSMLMAGLTTVPRLKTDTIGVLFSNRTSEDKNEVGCFVQAVPVYLYERRFVLEMAKGVRCQVGQIHASLKNKEPLPVPPGFNVMFSMVKNPDTVLHGPEGVSVKYLRRLHAKPECPLHIYVYQYKEKLEIVFNYDPDHWDHNDLENMLNQYIGNLIKLSRQKNWQSVPFNNVGSKMPEVRFDHVGVATWEMDIGLMRLKADCNIDSPKRRVKDSTMDVELASFDVGITSQIELVAPLSKKAPCVGFLDRLGEGPYHCCWQTTSIEKVLEILNQRAINYTMIERYGQSALFPETPILFLLVQGIGLVEFIERKQLSDQPSEPLSLEIVSNDLENAAKFFHMLGYKPDHPAKATWQVPRRIFIKMQVKEGAKESFVYRISSIHHDKNEIARSSPQSLSDTWKQRVCI